MARHPTVIPLNSRRLQPPESLSDGARRIFVDVVGSLPPAHFRAEDITLLSAYATAAEAAERAAFEMSQPGGLVTAEGRTSPWFAIHTAATKTMVGLALRLRLAPQSRVAKASKQSPPAPLSYYERQEMLEREQ
jgi:phage terminase small subunit